MYLSKKFEIEEVTYAHAHVSSRVLNLDDRNWRIRDYVRSDPRRMVNYRELSREKDGEEVVDCFLSAGERN